MNAVPLHHVHVSVTYGRSSPSLLFVYGDKRLRRRLIQKPTPRLLNLIDTANIVGKSIAYPCMTTSSLSVSYYPV